MKDEGRLGLDSRHKNSYAAIERRRSQMHGKRLGAILTAGCLLFSALPLSSEAEKMEWDVPQPMRLH